MATLDSAKTMLNRRKLIGGATALGGMIVGAIVGIGVQVGIESTGALGPSVDILLAEQQSNFDAVNARLDLLRQSTDDPEVNAELDQLAALLKRQDELRQQAGSELAVLSNEVTSLREQTLKEKGFAGGADFWLKAGESVNVGDSRHVLGVNRVWGQVVDVTLNGEKSRLNVGDMVNTDDCTVFFKQGIRETDGRVGFDLSCG